ncbi:MAG: hypothetical protein QOI51_121 [Nocardioidaceae bacterium]|nr:hypothetical protein [Nocardioidaceae bacterium]
MSRLLGRPHEKPAHRLDECSKRGCFEAIHFVYAGDVGAEEADDDLATMPQQRTVAGGGLIPDFVREVAGWGPHAREAWSAYLVGMRGPRTG